VKREDVKNGGSPFTDKKLFISAAVKEFFLFYVRCVLIYTYSVFLREVEAGLMEYKPDIIINAHPLMQHIPLWVLKY